MFHNTVCYFHFLSGNICFAFQHVQGTLYRYPANRLKWVKLLKKKTITEVTLQNGIIVSYLDVTVPAQSEEMRREILARNRCNLKVILE